MSSVIIAGDTSGTITLTAPAVAGSGVLTLPVATDTLVGKATTDTLTNKTLTGAVINGTVGATTPAAGAFTTLSASGQGAINSAIATNSTFQVAGTYAGTGGLFDGGLYVNVDGGTMGVNRTISQSYFGYGPDNAASTITTAASGTNDISTITIFPYVITSGGATLTNSTTLAINDAPNLGTNKRALWVKAGMSQLDGGLAVTGTLSATGLISSSLDAAIVLDVGGGARVHHYAYTDNGGSGITNTNPYTSGSMVYLEGGSTKIYSGASLISTTSSTGLTVTGTIVSNGNYIYANASTATPAGGTSDRGFAMGSASVGITWGSGAPTLGATKGSLYLRTDGTGTNDRMYVNTNGSTAWTAVVTVA